MIGIESEDSGSKWGWDMFGLGKPSMNDDDHVVYVMKPKPPAHEFTSGTQILIQEEAPSKPSASEVLVVESPRHLLERGIQKIKDTFSGIFKIGKGIKENIDSSVSSLFKKEVPNDAQVIVIEPHIVTVPAAEHVVTRTVMVQQKPHTHAHMKGHFRLHKRAATTVAPQYSKGEEIT